MTAETQADRKTEGLGEALRQIRKERGWRLSDLSQRTGFPVSTLSKIENGHLSLSYDKLIRLSQSLQVDIAQLFSTKLSPTDGPVSGRRSVIRWGVGELIATRSYNHLYPASELVKKSLVPIIAELRAHTLEEFGDLIQHPGEEYAIVLEGACVLHTSLYTPVHLERGDSVYFDSSMGHAYLASGSDPCWVLSVCSATEPALMEKFPPSRTREPRKVPAPTALKTVSNTTLEPVGKSAGAATKGRAKARRS